MTDTIQTGNWRYELCDLDSMPSNNQKYMAFINPWRSKFKDQRLPARKDFSFEDFSGLHGWITIDEVYYDPFDMKCTLYGSNLAISENREETNQYLSTYIDDTPEGLHQKHYLEIHKQAAFQRRITHSAGSRMYKNIPVSTEWIGLPCADDGEKISHFISLVWRCTIKELTQLNFA